MSFSVDPAALLSAGDPDQTGSPRTVVVGGGIAGLTAAHLLGVDGARPLLLEAGDRLGGKLRLQEVAGVAVDVGAEAMLNRRPEGVDLARELGLPIVHPTSAESQILSRGSLHPLPRTLMGIPLDLDDLTASGVLSDEGLDAVRREPSLPVTVVEGDVSVGEVVAARFGDEVVDRLVEPLLGGVYSGLAWEISTRAAVPMLLPMLAKGSLLEQGARIPRTYDAPVFACVEGGMGRLPGALEDSGRFEARTDVRVTSLRRSGPGFVVVADGQEIVADRLVLATPPAETARLLAPIAPDAAADLAAIESASTVVVTFAFRAADVPDLPGSGFLVPPVEAGRRVKASTFSFAKWGWVREAGRGAGPEGEDLLFLRTSLGRHRESAVGALSDDELVAVSLAELADAVGLRAEPLATHVQRWTDGLPQYAVGHVDRVARVRAAVARIPGLAVCGAAYDGVGIPAVIASAAVAAESLTG
ncbi:MAG: FAD-dependent oxidoreductase [Nocardioidaceae bacterium]|nr:FAD-dependent oxidoreductase [Nocardioidaceae bacterium]